MIIEIKSLDSRPRPAETRRDCHCRD